MEDQLPEENGSREPPVVVQHAGGFEITIKVAEPISPKSKVAEPVSPKNKESEPVSEPVSPKNKVAEPTPKRESNKNIQSQDDHADQPPMTQTTMAKGIQRSFSAASSLGSFLPTGSILIFESILPSIYRNGQCSALSTVMITVLLGACVFFCFFSAFTDSFDRSDGGGTVYGIVTPKGLRAYKWELIGDDRYKLGFADVLHATMSVVVFLAIAFSDHRVIDCLFPRHVKDVEQVMESLVLIVGFVCSSLFLLFPVSRRGFVPALPINVSRAGQ